MSKVWFVTGASAGIGTGVVKAALAAGDRVVATARNVEKLRAAIGQAGDPAKLGKALVQIAAMESPPKQFFAGSDAVAGITADLKARLAEVEAHHALSQSTDGNF